MVADLAGNARPASSHESPLQRWAWNVHWCVHLGTFSVWTTEETCAGSREVVVSLADSLSQPSAIHLATALHSHCNTTCLTSGCGLGLHPVLHGGGIRTSGKIPPRPISNV